MDAPYKHLGVRYIPLGGITQNNLADYAKLNQILAIGGSWIANKELIRAGKWSEITSGARAAKDLWDSIRRK